MQRDFKKSFLKKQKINTPLLHSLLVQQCKYTKTNLQLRDRAALGTTLNENHFSVHYKDFSSETTEYLTSSQNVIFI